MAFVSTVGQRLDVAQSRKRVPKVPPTLVDPALRRRRTLLIGLAAQHRFGTDDLAAILGVSRRHIQKEIGKFKRVSRILLEARDGE